MTAYDLAGATLVAFELGDASHEVLILHLERLDRGGNGSQLSDGDVAMWRLAGLRSRDLLETVDNGLVDGELVDRTCVDEQRLIGSGADKRLEIGQSSNQHFVRRPLAALESLSSFDSYLEVSWDLKLVSHVAFLSLVETSTVGAGLPLGHCTGHFEFGEAA